MRSASGTAAVLPAQPLPDCKRTTWPSSCTTLLLAAALPVQGTDAPLGRRTKIGVVGIILCVVASSLVVALNWTPINCQTLFGLQGRYWLPILPLVLVLCKV